MPLEKKGVTGLRALNTLLEAFDFGGSSVLDVVLAGGNQHMIGCLTDHRSGLPRIEPCGRGTIGSLDFET